ncbi:unnamed protein product [Larinioides sclopetarius]|uniref:Uncharacterized protein n=1 Tax=Larinioides sclopetarius TaxID=280406 RepID=A0AAV2APA5_9ARAC
MRCILNSRHRTFLQFFTRKFRPAEVHFCAPVVTIPLSSRYHQKVAA